MMEVRKELTVDLAALDAVLLDGEGRMRALPAQELATIPHPVLVAWCQQRGRYCVPSLELGSWLKGKIAGRRAIEIGAGAGDLGRLLGIPMTDSYVQIERPDLLAYYAMLGVAPTRPPADVEKLSALEAIETYRPEVVVGAWITQLYRDGDEGPPLIGSSVYGVDELIIRSAGRTYVHVGHLKVHHQKRILRFRHTSHRLPFLFSRAFDETGNVVQMWAGTHQ